MSFNGTIHGMQLVKLKMGRQGGRRSCNQRTHPIQLKIYVASTYAQITRAQLFGIIVSMVISLHHTMLD